jgi:gliding motility-associated-like protein
MQAYPYLFIVTLLTFLSHFLQAQAPIISEIEPQQATVNEVVSIHGSGFGSDADNLRVLFGAASGQIVSASDNLLKVSVPAGATIGSVAVVRLDTRLSAYSPRQFYLSFDGAGFETDRLDGPHTFATSDAGLYNLCMCDFNLDGRVDIATSDTGNDQVTILENSSTDISSVDFTPREIDINANTRWVRCHDLNGDGLADLIFSASNTDSNKERVYVYQNTSTPGGDIAFALPNPPLSYTIDGTLAARMDIKDLDGDGKPELVAVAISSDGGISVFRNTSSGGSISFEPTFILPFAQLGISSVELSGIDLEDLDGDGKPEIIASEDERSGVYVLKNASTPGNISFDGHLSLSATGQTTNMRAADLDGDGLPEVVIVNGAYVGIFKNNSTSGNLAFADAARFDQTLISREGLELADMDGNGKLDIIVASTINRIVVLLNNSTADNLDFNTKRTILSSENTLSVRAGDLNGDGKPDLAFTETASDVVTVQINRNCIRPVLEPQAGLGVCDQLPYQLSVTRAVDVSYTWEISADGSSFNPIADGTDSTFTYTAETEAYYRVKVSSSHNGFDCTELVSNVVQVVRPEGFVPDKPTIIDQNPEDPICFGDRIILRAQNVNARFFWTGPNGFTSNEQNPVISNASKDKEGLYVLYVQAAEQAGGCISDTATTFIRVSEPEEISISSDDPLVLLEGGEATLTVESIEGSTYSWSRDGRLVSGATNTSLTVTEPGTYVAMIQNETGCTRQSAGLQVAMAQATMPTEVCLNEAVEVAVSPENLNGQAIRYRWNFGDGTASQSGSIASHVFAQAGTYTMQLEVLAADNSVADTYTQEINVLEIPNLRVVPTGNPNLCPDEQVSLQASEGFSAYAWEHGESGNSITVAEAGTYVLNATTENGCVETASISVANADNPDATIEASGAQVALGDTIQLTARGGVDYLWSPGASLSDSTIANPIARPLLTTTYSCVVTNAEGCQTTVTYTVQVDRTLDVAPNKAFTPNGDGRNDTWYIERMDLFPDCTLSLYDRQGAKLHEIPNYSNNYGWDGTINGSPLPDGVYYYTIDCGGEAGSRSGSVTILR